MPDNFKEPKTTQWLFCDRCVSGRRWPSHFIDTPRVENAIVDRTDAQFATVIYEHNVKQRGGSWRICWNVLDSLSLSVGPICVIAPLYYENVTLSTEPEVHNVLRCHRMRQQKTRTNFLWSVVLFGVWTCSFWDIRAGRLKTQVGPRPTEKRKYRRMEYASTEYVSMNMQRWKT